MTAEDLAAVDAASRRQTLINAIAEERRGLAIRACQGGRLDNIARNIARLERALEAEK